MIEVKEVSKIYRERRFLKEVRIQALRDITLTFEEGSCTSLLGPNGSGKSTLIRILIGLTLPDRGEVLIAKRNPFFSRFQIGYLGEFNSLPDFLKPREFLFLIGRLFSLPETIINQRIDYFFEKFLLDEEEKPIYKLSSGNKRKLLIIQALLNEPEILILDEPTVYLDIPTKEIFYNYLIKLKEKKKTIVISSHLFSEIERIADRIIIIREGQIRKNFLKKELLLNADWEREIIKEIS